MDTHLPSPLIVQRELLSETLPLGAEKWKVSEKHFLNLSEIKTSIKNQYYVENK